MKITYDMTDCTRCGGSGQMPFSTYGGVCFRCKGKGRTLTPAGLRAHRKVEEVREQLCVVAASSVKPGQKILDHRGRAHTVATVEVTLGKGNGGFNDPITHEPIAYSLGETRINAGSVSHQGPAHRPVKVAWTREALEVAAAAVANMKGATVTY